MVDGWLVDGWVNQSIIGWVGRNPGPFVFPPPPPANGYIRMQFGKIGSGRIQFFDVVVADILPAAADTKKESLI
jgi:hypothetical protein